MARPSLVNTFHPFAEVDDILSDRAITYGRDYIKYLTKQLVDYPHLYDMLSKLGELFETREVIIYFIDPDKNKITYRQVNSYEKEILDIPIESGKILAATVAHEKRAYFIENPISFTKQHRHMHLDMDILKNCIYCFPVLNSIKDVLLVVELSRSDGGSFAKSDCQYLNEFAKLCGLVMEQTHQEAIEKNKQHLHGVMRNIVSNYLVTPATEYDKFLIKILKYFIKTVQTKAIAYYDITMTEHNLHLAELTVVKADNPKHFLSSLVIQKDADIVYSVIKSGVCLNLKVDQDNLPKINKFIKVVLKNDIHNVLFVPIKSNDSVVAIFALINSQRSVEFTKSDEDFCKMIAFYTHISREFTKISKELKTEHGNSEKEREALEYELLRILKISDECHADVEIPPKFYEFQWYPVLDTKYLSLIFAMIDELCPNCFQERILEILIRSVKNSTRFLPYHNFIQIIINTHFVYLILRNSESNYFTIEEKAALMIFSICKYINYIGFDNETLFLMKHPITKDVPNMYIERNALNWTICFIERSKILNGFPTESVTRIMRLITQFFKAPINTHLSKFKTVLYKYINDTSLKVNDIKFSLLIWGAEHCRYLKNFQICNHLNQNFRNQLYAIGDIQKKLHLKTSISPAHDRNNQSEIPTMECKLIDELIFPLYELMAKYFPKSAEIVKLCYVTQQGFRLIQKEHRFATRKFLLEESYANNTEFHEMKAILNSPILQEFV